MKFEADYLFVDEGRGMIVGLKRFEDAFEAKWEAERMSKEKNDKIRVYVRVGGQDYDNF